MDKQLVWIDEQQRWIAMIQDTETLNWTKLPNKYKLFRVSYQHEALPYEHWGVKVVKYNAFDRGENISCYRYFEDHSSGLTVVDTVFVLAKTLAEARYEGGSFLLDRIPEYRNPLVLERKAMELKKEPSGFWSRICRRFIS